MLEQIAVECTPLFIFVTGYSEFAYKAFEIDAVDYLCKPFDKERLVISLDRATRRLSVQSGAPVGGPQASQWLTRLTIKNEDGIVFVPADQILWIEAANKYVVVHKRQPYSAADNPEPRRHAGPQAVSPNTPIDPGSQSCCAGSPSALSRGLYGSTNQW